MHPFPIRIIGRFDSEIILTALLVRSLLGLALNASSGFIGLIPDSFIAMSWGNSRCIAPAFSSNAILNTLLIILGMLSALRINHLHFVIG